MREGKRSRITYAILILTVIVLGLASRIDSRSLPLLIKTYAGDSLWALAAYLTIAFIFPDLSIRMVAAIALLFSFIVEVSQLYHAPWVDEIRNFRLGSLLLGHGFLWSDLICYAAGIGVGILLEWSAKRQLSSNKQTPKF